MAYLLCNIAIIFHSLLDNHSNKQIEILQINLHHSKGASANLCAGLKKMQTAVALIQEPWVYRERVRGLSFTGGSCVYNAQREKPRAAIVVTKQVRYNIVCALPDSVAIQIELNTDNYKGKVVLASVYLPYNAVELPPGRGLTRIVEHCQMHKTPLLVGCDSNSHHTAWGSSDINPRGRALLEYLIVQNIYIYDKRQ